MDYSLIFKLTFSLFSFDPTNMRWFNTRRIIISLFIIPLFIFILVLNRLMLFLDKIFFPGFLQTKILRPVFIISAPRSATTYLFHLLSSDQTNFTSFRLWEIIFAPSVIQKYILKYIIYYDRKTGSLLKRSTLYLENRIFGDFKYIHKIGLHLPEEDEAILLWNMSTIYLNFFFPDTDHFRNYFCFDDSMPLKKKNAIMKYYAGCIQRHNYVFNKNGAKSFLSKNPAMMAKVKSLHSFFPDALIVNINRCVAETIPSTIALNNNIYRFFTNRKASPEIEKKTCDILIQWYKMAHKNLKSYYPSQTLEVDFFNLVNSDRETINNICAFMTIDPLIFPSVNNREKMKKDHTSRNNYSKMEAKELNHILAELSFLQVYCRDGRNMDNEKMAAEEISG